MVVNQGVKRKCVGLWWLNCDVDFLLSNWYEFKDENALKIIVSPFWSLLTMWIRLGRDYLRLMDWIFEVWIIAPNQDGIIKIDGASKQIKCLLLELSKFPHLLHSFLFLFRSFGMAQGLCFEMSLTQVAILATKTTWNIRFVASSLKERLYKRISPWSAKCFAF